MGPSEVFAVSIPEFAVFKSVGTTRGQGIIRVAVVLVAKKSNILIFWKI